MLIQISNINLLLERILYISIDTQSVLPELLLIHGMMLAWRTGNAGIFSTVQLQSDTKLLYRKGTPLSTFRTGVLQNMQLLVVIFN